MTARPYSAAETAALADRIDAWLLTQAADNPLVEAVVRDETDPLRWYVRMAGEEKDHTTVRLHLRQRSLHHETHLMPAPEENHGELYEHLLRRTTSLHGAAFAIGHEDAVYLVGRTPVEALDTGEIDRILGSSWEVVERCFRPALRIGFASRFG